jgi:hypothetical protein
LLARVLKEMANWDIKCYKPASSNPDEINRDINQKVKKRIPTFKHQKKISGRPSIGNISSGHQALEYAVQKVAATPMTGRYVAKNYTDVLQNNGHCITGSAIKEASRPFKKKCVVASKS